MVILVNCKRDNWAGLQVETTPVLSLITSVHVSKKFRSSTHFAAA